MKDISECSSPIIKTFSVIHVYIWTFMCNYDSIHVFRKKIYIKLKPVHPFLSLKWIYLLVYNEPTVENEELKPNNKTWRVYVSLWLKLDLFWILKMTTWKYSCYTSTFNPNIWKKSNAFKDKRHIHLGSKKQQHTSRRESFECLPRQF